MSRFLILIIAIGIYFTSCSYNKKNIPWEVEYKMHIDSLLKVDSILKDSLASIIDNAALEQIKFGMSKIEFEKAKQQFMDSIKGPLDDYFLEDTEFYNIYPSYNKKGKLYQLIVATGGVYELEKPEDIYSTGAFVRYLNIKYGLSKNNKNEEWIIGKTSFTRRPGYIKDKSKLIVNPKWTNGSTQEEKYIMKYTIECTIDLVIENSKYIDK